jgi:hypothetical protein
MPVEQLGKRLNTTWDNAESRLESPQAILFAMQVLL